MIPEVVIHWDKIAMLIIATAAVVWLVGSFIILIIAIAVLIDSWFAPPLMSEGSSVKKWFYISIPGMLFLVLLYMITVGLIDVNW